MKLSLNSIILIIVLSLFSSFSAMSADMQGVTVAGATFNPAAAAGYTWSLGDLASYSSRLDVDWDHSQWANAYDTEAELTNAGGVDWTLVTFEDDDIDVGTDANGIADAEIECDAGGSGNSQDEAAILALFAGHCNTNPGNSAPLVCNNVFKIPASCTLDVTANTHATSPAVELLPALMLRYSNYAIIGGSKTTSKLLANNTMIDNDQGIGALLGNNQSSWEGGGDTGSTDYGWTTGNSTKGTTVVTVTTCIGLEKDPTDSDKMNEASIILLTGTDADGQGMMYQTRIADLTGTGPCDITLTDPIPATFNTKTSIKEITLVRTNHVIFLNFTMGFPFIDAGICTLEPRSNVGHGCGSLFKTYGINNFLAQGMILGPFGHFGADTRNYQYVIRHNTIGPHRHGQRRANNNNHMENAGGSLISYYNNTHLEGMVRITMTKNSVFGSYYGFNHQVSQTVPNSNDDATGGDYCNAGGTGGLYGVQSGGPERSVYTNHDDASDGLNPTPTGVGHFLMEANTFRCRYREDDAQGPQFQPVSRYATMYRNRFPGTNAAWGEVEIPSGSQVSSYMNWIANRAVNWNLIAAGRIVNALGLYNVDPDTTFNAPTATGITWPTTGVGRNYVASGAHSDYATANIPPSLGFRNNLPPSWWCTESGPWNGTYSFGYGDGGDNGGVPRKSPAQIRYEGGTCTAPAASVDYGTP